MPSIVLSSLLVVTKFILKCTLWRWMFMICKYLIEIIKNILCMTSPFVFWQGISQCVFLSYGSHIWSDFNRVGNKNVIIKLEKPWSHYITVLMFYTLVFYVPFIIAVCLRFCCCKIERFPSKVKDFLFILSCADGIWVWFTLNETSISKGLILRICKGLIGIIKVYSLLPLLSLGEGNPQ